MRPIVIAHRGASAEAPENTLAAFRAAREQGADMIELDARWSADGEPVLMHDPTIDRTTDGHGPLAALGLREIRSLDAGSWFSPRFRGERVLTLQEALVILGPRIRLNIELCADVAPPAGFAARLMRLVEDARLPEPPLFSCFDFSLLAAVRAEDPRASIAPLFRERGEPILRRVLALRPAAAHPRHHLVEPGLLSRLHEEGMRVHAWTVNDTKEARRLLRLGVDGIFTDHPARMVRLRDEEEQAAAPARRRAASCRPTRDRAMRASSGPTDAAAGRRAAAKPRRPRPKRRAAASAGNTARPAPRKRRRT